MEKQTPLVSKILNGFLLLVFLFISASDLTAQDSVADAHEPQLKYIGIAKGKLVFQLDYNRERSGQFILEIVDQDGYELYRERSSSKKFRKHFAIDENDLINNTISVIVTAEGAPQKFSIKRTARTVEDIKIEKNQ